MERSSPIGHKELVGALEETWNHTEAAAEVDGLLITSQCESNFQSGDRENLHIYGNHNNQLIMQLLGSKILRTSLQDIVVHLCICFLYLK